MTDDSRLDALRHLLAKHEPTDSDRLVGHRVIYAEPDARVQMTWKDRAAALLRLKYRRLSA